MSDKEPTEPAEPQEPQEPANDQDAFWTQFRKEVSTVVDARLAERDKKRKEKSDDKRRSDAKRTTVPGMIADLMFGKDK